MIPITDFFSSSNIYFNSIIVNDRSNKKRERERGGGGKNTTNELNYLREIDITLLLTISNSQPRDPINRDYREY